MGNLRLCRARGGNTTRPGGVNEGGGDCRLLQKATGKDLGPRPTARTPEAVIGNVWIAAAKAVAKAVAKPAATAIAKAVASREMPAGTPTRIAKVSGGAISVI